ncbi:epimerase [Sulfitobacter sp. G21635-S1]|uniref:epimerase n=1 Tax=Sulfitobacter sp. G21635-S1 TaxID=3014043 RepID=UPI0022AFE037|nr:epimerase [Sulfitobacter sp. G21635-S1]MCZ4255169.1 epimerase [Sulfitobacter sp. G21635-S1]
MSRTVLILGASGFAGQAFDRAFSADGWRVRRFQRGTDPAQAARGADLIVNAMNPPDYHDWARQIPKITELAMAAARASGARVLIPGNVYVYGNQPGPWSAETPHRACSRKGQIRVEMEAAWRASGLPVTILRGGDFIDDQRSGQAIGLVVLKKLHKGRITAMGAPGVERAYAYLPDFARAAVALSKLDDLPVFADVALPGHSFSIDDLAREITRQSGRAMKIGQFPWWALRLSAPVWELGRELLEQRYLFDHPHRLCGEKFAALCPAFRHTPFEEMVGRLIQLHNAG